MTIHPLTRRTAVALAACAAWAAGFVPATALAWGHAGHVAIGRLAVRALPEDLPLFLRSEHAAAQVGEISAEPDVSKSAGAVTSAPAASAVRTAANVHDAERDSGHFIDVDDADGKVLGGVASLARLPATREAFDTLQRTGGQTQYTVGYLPYAVIDAFQQVRKDLGLWRALKAGLASSTSDRDRDWFRAALGLRERLTLRDVGYLGHFVGDGSQPLHLSIHYNGWGTYPNPDGFTLAPIHGAFEGGFVRKYIDVDVVAKAMRPYADRGAATIEQRVPVYLAETLAQVRPLYQAAKDAEGDDYATDRPGERALVTARLAAGASELRDVIVDAWRQSADVAVGYPLLRVRDVEAGRVAVTPATFGSD